MFPLRWQGNVGRIGYTGWSKVSINHCLMLRNMSQAENTDCLDVKVTNIKHISGSQSSTAVFAI